MTLELYLETLLPYTGRDVADACKALLSEWPYQEAPKPAKIIERVWQQIRDRRKTEARVETRPHPAPRSRGDKEVRRHWLGLVRKADETTPAELWEHEILTKTSGMEIGRFARVCQKLERRGCVPIADFWAAWDQCEAEDRAAP